MKMNSSSHLSWKWCCQKEDHSMIRKSNNDTVLCLTKKKIGAPASIQNTQICCAVTKKNYLLTLPSIGPAMHNDVMIG